MWLLLSAASQFRQGGDTMQGLLDAPRTDLTEDQVRFALQGSPTLQVSYGLEIVIPSTSYLPLDSQAFLDVSDILVDGVVMHDNSAAISGTATLSLDPNLYEVLHGYALIPPYGPAEIAPENSFSLIWGNPVTRLRPYMVLTPGGGVPCKFYLGLFVPATPSVSNVSFGSGSQYDVTCYDSTAVLNTEIGDSFSVASGANVLSAVQSIIQAQDPLAHLWYLADSSSGATTLSAPMTWAIGSNTTWLDVINQLLKAIGYNSLWCDEYGYYRATPYVAQVARESEYLLDATNSENVIDPSSTSWVPDVWGIPNRWVFVNNSVTATPTEGAGKYTVNNINSGPTSQAAQNRILPTYVTLTAANQTDLETQGDAIVTDTILPFESWSINTGPLPIAGHQDIMTLNFPELEPNRITGGSSRKAYALSWAMPLNGDDMTWT